MTEQPFQTVLIASAERSGSTALNVSLIRHPDIFGWEYELRFFGGVAALTERVERFDPARANDIIHSLFVEFCRLTGWHGQPWVVHKDPHEATRIDQAVVWSQASRVILLLRNPYAIVHSLLDHLKSPVRGGPVEASPREACFRARSYYERLLDFEARRPERVYRVRYEDLALQPRDVLADVLREVFQLQFHPNCLDLSRVCLPRGYGDLKISKTTAWQVSSVDDWRIGLAVEEKRYVKTNCKELFERFGYDPDDT